MASLRLSKLRFGDQQAALSLEIAGGEVLCLSGASGSGKSRLLRALADLDAHEGEVWLGDQEHQRLPAHLWRQKLRLVPAESPWWYDQVGEHFPEQIRDDTGLRLDLEKLGLPAAALDWPVSRLSSGEKQRLALLRALAWPLEALLLDEPTANLDSATALRVEAWLLEHLQAKAWPTLWVSHDRQQIQRVATHHYTLEAGQLKAGIFNGTD